MNPTLLFVLSCFLGFPSQGDLRTDSAVATQEAAQTAPKNLEASRVQLLEQAFAIASKIPTKPHIKSRCHTQEQVFVTCMELEQPELAWAFAERIDNWRKGSAFGDLALYFVENGQPEQAQVCLDKAQAVVQANTEEGESWRRDRVEAKIHSARAAMDRLSSAAAESQGVKPAAAPRNATPEEAEVQAQLATLAEVAQTADLEGTHQAMLGLVGLYERCLASPELADQVYQGMRGSWKLLPGLIRVDLAFALVEVDLRHHNQAHAQHLLEETRSMMDGMVWETRHRVPAIARLAKLRLQAGQAELAREEADGALEVYRSGRADTIDIYRTQALLPLAEVMHALGDPKAADAMYTLALNEALVNPNSRPRAQDLCAILCSMAREGYVAPEAWTQSCQAAIAALSDPW